MSYIIIVMLEIINDVTEELSNNNIIYDEKKIMVFANVVYKKIKEKHNNINYNLILQIMNKIIKPKYKIKNIEHDLKYYRDYEELLPEVKIPKKYKELQDHFNKLKDLPQPEQRSKEWFEYRHNRITASDTASAIDLNPYEPVEGFILKKCDPEHKFLDNQNVYHGKCFEQVATLIYEHIYNNKVIEFGALPSEKYKLLGASPDGICSCKTLDNKFSPLLGRMLEIKCTVMRKIYTSGEIMGHICPFYYFCQVQQQLECCDLDYCDFWQCKISQYKDRESYLIDECLYTEHTFGTNGEKMEIDMLIKKGIILKFLPKEFTPEFEGDSIEWKSKFIYPNKLNMNEIEYDRWVVNILSSWREIYPELEKTHYYDKIVYWKLNSSHNVTIKRDKAFFSKLLPILHDTWEKVEYYRKNIDKLNELKEIIKKRTKYTTFKTSIQINNNLVNDKILFLYDLKNNIKNNNLKNTIKKKNDCEFLD